MTSLIEREQAVLFQNYRRLPIAIDHARGMEITDVNGNVWLDFLGGIAVNALGHSHAKVIDAITQQVHRYMHVSNFFYQEPQVAMAERLTKLTGYPRTFFTNSGTEATEGAIKLARKFGSTTGRYDIIGFTGGFHGRTYGALSIMDKPLYRDGFGPFLPNSLVLPFNDVDALESRVDENTCAVMLEFIQGEGGLMSASAEFVDAIIALKQKYGFLVIADEVQTGVGRTGSFFAFEDYGITPDIVTIAKPLGGGLPLGAILATEQVAALFDKGMHGTTYGGNAVACAAGNVVLDEVANGLQQHVREIGEYLYVALESLHQRHPRRIASIRGRGCMQGIVLNEDAAPLVKGLLDRHIITNATANTVIRLVPPFIVEREHVDRLIAALDDVLA
jgi:predicted acetylornithine/succinylornithine family transaminase